MTLSACLIEDILPRLATLASIPRCFGKFADRALSALVMIFCIVVAFRVIFSDPAKRTGLLAGDIIKAPHITVRA